MGQHQHRNTTARGARTALARQIGGIAAIALLGAGCGSTEAAGGSAGPVVATSTAATSRVPSAPAGPSATAVSSPSPSPTGPPHFDTPEAAMRYLATAWNSNDLVDERHVTNPAARDLLDQMHSMAVNLRLSGCTERPQGDYSCSFVHDYPAALHKAGHGQAVFIAGPARGPGWYMTVFVGCG
jgi:hypothetical protein